MTDDVHDQPTGADLPGDADFDIEIRESFEAVLDRFEAAWRSGEPDIAEYAAARPGDEALVLELCLVDQERRRQRGLPESLEAYASRFPAVADLLRNLATISLADAAARESRATADLVGREIGDVTIVRLIGEGGMGRVYEGRQRRPRRPVAVKVMQPGVASPALLKRFEYEAQVLARLQHPGIAHIYAIGTHEVDGQAVPYFVMEYIPNAKTLTQYAEEQKLSTHERLELFQKVCDAVAHGHQKGVIHRDLKPANVVVDATGQPKVIDFGVAKATGSDLALTTMQTDVGAIIGTLQYMSPEQFDADPDDLDVRLDVYALGVVLYELLTGKPPYDVRRKAIYEVARVVREEEPTPIASLDKTLRRDVAVIAGKCLEKDRARRYSSAAELAGDVSRYLAGEPITAAPPSLWDGVARLARRHKAATVAVVGVAASLVAAVVGISAFAIRAERARETAVKARAATEQLLRVTTAQRLAVASQQAQTAGFMPRGILLGVAAVKSTTRFNEPVVPEAEQALRTALAKMPHGTRHTLGGAVEVLVASPEPVEVMHHRFTPGVDAIEPYDPIVFPSLDDARPARWLFATCNDGSLHACDLLQQPRTMQRIERGVHHAPSLVVSADERWLAAGLRNGIVRVWELTGASPQVRHDLAPPTTTAARCMAIGPDGRRLAAGYESGAIRLWDLSDSDPARTSWVLQGHTKSVRSLQIDPDARLLASEGNDGTIHIWDLMQSSAHAAVQTLKPKSEHADAGRSLAFGSRSRLLASKGPRLWDLAAGESAEPMDLDNGASDVFFTSFDRWLLGVSYRGATAWDLGDRDGNESAPRSKPKPHRFGVEDANFLIPSASPFGCYLAAGRTVRHWKLPHAGEDGPTPAEEFYCGHDSDVSAIAVSHDGTCLFTGDRDGVVQIWNLEGSGETGQADFTWPLENWQLKDRSPSASPSLSADHRWLFVKRDPHHDRSVPPTDRALDVSCNPPRPVVLDVTASDTKPPSRDPGEQPEPGTSGCDTPITAASFCAHGNTLVAAVTTPESNRIVSWTLTQSATASPRTLVADCGKEAPRYVLASPDLGWLVSSDMQEVLTLWNLRGSGPPAGRVIDGAAFYIAAYPTLLEFSPDGRWLVIAGGDDMQRLLLFDLDGKPEAALDLRPGELTRFQARRDNGVRSGQFTCSTFSPDSRWLFVSDLGGNVYRIDLRADRLLDAVVGANVESGSVRQVKHSPDGLWIACSLNDNRVGLWDSRTFSSTARPTLLVGHEDSISCLAFGAGNQLASGSDDKTVRLWKLSPLQHGKAPDCQVFEAGDRVRLVGFTADGKVLNAVTSEGIRGWRLGIDAVITDALRRVGRDLTADERAQYGIDYALDP